jgi:hypothetical protein
VLVMEPMTQCADRLLCLAGGRSPSHQRRAPYVRFESLEPLQNDAPTRIVTAVFAIDRRNFASNNGGVPVAFRFENMRTRGKNASYAKEPVAGQAEQCSLARYPVDY